MDNKKEFLKKLLETFRVEAEEGLKKISSNMVKLESKPSDSDAMKIIEIIFREVHSLKGAARAVNLLDIETVCQTFESVMYALKNKKIKVKPVVFELMNQTIDLLNDLCGNGSHTPDLKNQMQLVLKNLFLIETGKFDERQISENTILNSKKSLSKVLEIKSEEHREKDNENEGLTKDQSATKEDSLVETIRVSTQKLDNLLFQTEEMLSIKLATLQQIDYLKAVLNKLNVWKKESSNVSVAIRDVKQIFEQKQDALSKEDKLIENIILFSDWSVSQINAVEDDLIELRKFSVQESFLSSNKIETLLDDVKELITVPFSLLIDTFPKVIRNLAKDMEKVVEFKTLGVNTEIDRRVLELITHPLMHILRNCIDYGIEKPKTRIEKNKPQKGSIKIEVERLENNKVKIQISDDGAGIDLDKLRKLYIKNEKISSDDEANINERDLLFYIFRSGITTSDIVTDLSGRGLGLAIAYEKIEQLGGSIQVETKHNEGTCFTIEIPLTLVTFRGVLIKIASSEFVVPTAKILQVIQINANKIKLVENKATLPFNGEFIPFVNMSDILELAITKSDLEYIQVIVLGSINEKIGFAVDEIIGEQEVLVKKFNKHITRLKNISGATVLGSGKVVPILNVYDLIKSASKPHVSNVKTATNIETEADLKKVLVVEDSITSRTLLKNILETAGYLVTTAIDGVDGFIKLNENTFDAVISDVDMPRLNGFDLTAKIRADKTLSEIPVLLVTSLSKTEDKERGIEVGANAYIIKSSFDQSNLLEILNRLI
ncbi:MAG: response regulator [Salinivirgaceae bacterium]|nr:response regulator [Salinivirgaceae bacterium]